jgi:putative ABC transport system permease protein
MKWLRLARTRLFGLLHKRRLEAEMEEELRFHLRMRTEEYVAAGLSPAEASARAQQQFGNIALLKDEWRDVRGGGAIEILWRDLQFGARMLVKDRALSMTAIMALALGIGANTAIFTVISSVLLRPLPYPQPNELMAIWSSDRAHPETPFKVSYPDFRDLQSRNHTFHSLGAFLIGSYLVSNNGGASAQVQGASVSSEIFPMLGAKAALGRIFNRSDDEPGNRAVIISEKLWEERFARAANVTGTTLNVEGQPYVIVGVMPRAFRFPVQNSDAQLWVTLGRDQEPFPDGTPAFTTRRDGHYLRLLGRLNPGRSVAEATTDLNAIAADLAEKYPDTNLHFDACAVTPWLADLTNKVRPALLMLIVAAGCLLAVACANVANLLLARGSTRQREIAIRAALGAGRRRIARQLLTESFVLALVGGTAGLLLAVFGTRFLVLLLPADFPRAGEIMPDIKVLVFAGIVTLVTSIVFGFAPAWRSARADLAPVLNDGSGASLQAQGTGRLHKGLIVAEMVLSLVLLAGACCLLESVWRLERASLGFNPTNVFTASLTFPYAPDGSEWSREIAFSNQLLTRVRNLRGVASASAVFPLPAIGAESLVDFGVVGQDLPKGDWPRARPRIVVPDYFHTLEVPVKEGRDFDQRDTRQSKPVVIINATLARKIFPNENPIGRRIIPGLDDSGGRAIEREIIGVVGDVTSNRLDAEQPAELYVPYAQCISFELSLLIRCRAQDGEALLAETGRIATELNNEVPFYGSSTLQEHLDLALAQPRLNSALLAAFALLAVVLTAIGVYGVVAYSVAQRRHEIGIRLVLGAPKSAILQLVLGENARVIILSVAAGSACSLLVLWRLGLYLQHSLGNTVSITSFVALLVSSVALIACWLPARRASREDPLAAMGLRRRRF